MERYDNLDLDLECDGGGVAHKAALFGGMFKRPSKAAEPSVQAQDSLSTSGELSKSNDSLTDSSSKEKGGVFKGMFKKATKAAKEGQPQDTLSIQNPELSVSSDSLTDNKSSKEKSGVLGGILKRSPKPGHARRPSQDLLDNEFTASKDSLSENTTTKETGGMFSGMFKKPSKPFGAKTQSQDDLSEPNELSGSKDNLSESNNTKEKGGIFSGVFRKKVAKSQSQDDLSVDTELSASSDSLIEKSSKRDKEKTEHSGDSSENTTAEKPKAKQNGFSAMMKSTFYTDKQEKNSDSDCEEIMDNGEGQPGHKQSKLAEAMTKLNPFRSANKPEKQAGSDDEDPPASSEKSSGSKQSGKVGAMSKLNIFRSGNKRDTEDTEDDKQVEEKPKVVKSNMIQRERKERSETPPVPPRPTEEEMKGTSTSDKVKPRGTEDNQDNVTSREKKAIAAESPVVPTRLTEEELSRAAKHSQQKQKSNHQSGKVGAMSKLNITRSANKSQSDDEGLKKDENTTKVKKHKHHNPFMLRAAAKAPSDDEGLKEEDDSSSKEEKKDEEGKDKTEETKVKKPRRHNPFMPRGKASSDDEGLKEEEDSSSKEEKKDEEGKDKTETKVKKPKRHNPFMPRVKGRQKPDGAAGTAENEDGNRSLFDRLEDFRIDPAQPEDGQDVENLMDWWNTVESWEDTPQDEDMTEKEEAKAFALTAEKVQKGIRVFNKLFSERAESLWQHVIDLNSIADGLDKFSKNTKIAQITGGSTSAIGGVATITGLALAPVTFGASLIVTAVGLGVATAGGLTSAGAGISNQVNNSMDRKKVEKIVQDYQEKMVDLNKCLTFIKKGIENLKKFDLMKMKESAYNRDFPVLSSSFYEDGAMAGKAILINANEIMRVVQIANVAGSTAARAVQIASMATGVLTGLFVGMDIYFVAKDSKELKKGAKSEFAAKIREVATQLHDGLVELNGIREELQSTAPENKDEGNDAAPLDSDKKEKDDKYDSSDEDEIDRIKKAIKKDMESREYV
ncbi:protein piccolo isoform X12 [Dicentrarchus labrax]|uniref:protein piccolo isoform X12 n=1 Tax=Dicentrarchus labrax TaxID=13489 RepID=UPI0021F64D90|nr:protein piccolo isoform X12 [Dicentrarchus labrax]